MRFLYLFVWSIVPGLLAPCAIFAADDANGAQDRSPKFELRDGDRVVFLGNTLIERAQKYGYWETMLTARYPNKNITFRNLGWSGDTVWAESRGIFDPPAVGYKRMIEHVGRLKPTVIFLGYGGNEAFAGKKGLPAFIKQYNKLLDDLTKSSAKGVRFVLLSPMNHVAMGPPLKSPAVINRSFKTYSNAIQSIVEERNAVFINVLDYFQLTMWNELLPPPILWTHDGYQLNSDGYQRFAEIVNYQLLHPGGRLWGPTGLGMRTEVRADGKKLKTFPKAGGPKVTDIKAVDGTLSFKVRLPSISFGFSHSLRITNLPLGYYSVRIAGEDYGKHRWADLSYKDARFEPSPEDKRREKLRQAIIDKNRLYFYRWRPQNITYLFLFRKHEQGQNAKEMAEFDKLIVAKEKEIAKLRKPVAHTYEIIRVKQDAAK